MARRCWVMVAVAGLVALTTVVPAPSSMAGAQTPASADAAWVDAVYRDVLNRRPSDAQRAHRLGQLGAGVTRRAIADQLTGSREHAELLVRALYIRIVGWEPDRRDIDFWVEALTHGTRPTTLASFLYGSMPIDDDHPASDVVTVFYRGILGREPDPAGLAYWTDQLEAGANPTKVARSWLLSAEATGLRAGLVFIDLLRRPPSALERDDWAQRLRRDDERRITAAVVSTPEYGRVVQQEHPDARLTSGNGHSRQPSTSWGDDVVAFASTATNLTPTGSPPGEDIFVFDRRTGRMRALTAGNGASTNPDVSADGEWVAFESVASNLVPGDDNGVMDVFLVSSWGGPITRLSDGSAPSRTPSIDYDGNVVTFVSAASDLVAGDDNGVADVFVHTDVPGGTDTLERIDATYAARAAMVAPDGKWLVLEVARTAELAVPHVMRVALPLGADPDLVVVAAGATQPSVSQRQVAYIRTTELAGRPLGEVWIASVDENDGSISGHTKLAGPSHLSAPRISAFDAGVVLVTSANDAPMRDEILFRRNAPPYDGILPVDSDIGYLGEFVVGSQGGQIHVYETFRTP